MTHQLQKLNYSHTALIDLIMANPAATNESLGAVFGRTKEWVGMVKNSDMFKEMYAQRAGELADPILSATLEQRLHMMTSRSLEVLQEKLSKRSDDIPDSLAIAAANLGAKGMALGGFSSKPPPPPEAPQAGRIERLAERLFALNTQPRQETVDVEFREVPNPSLSHSGSVPAL